MTLKTEALQARVASEYLKETDAVKSKVTAIKGSVSSGKTNLLNLKQLLIDNNLDLDGTKQAEIDAWITWLDNTATTINNISAYPE